MRGIVAHVLTLMGLIVLLAGAMVWQDREVEVRMVQDSQTLDWAVHTARATAALERMAAAESDYMLNGDPGRARIFEAGARTLSEQVAALGDVVPEARPANLSTLKATLRAWEDAGRVEMRQREAHSPALAARAQRLEDDVRSMLSDRSQFAAARVRQARADVVHENRIGMAFEVLALVLAIACCCVLGIRHFRRVGNAFASQQARLDEALREASRQNEILEQRVAERTAELAEKARLLDLAPCAVKVVRHNPPRLTYWNQGAEEAYGYTADEAMGRHPVDLLASKFGEDMKQIIATLYATGSWEGDCVETRKDGVGIVSHMRWALCADPKTGEQVVLSVATDVTEERRIKNELAQAKDAAEQASTAKSSFLANMSHELRTPLNAIIGYSEMLCEEAETGDLADVEAVAKDLRKVHGAGKHLLALINDILDLSKIEAGKMEVYIEPVEIAGLIGDVVNTIQPLAIKRGNVLDVRVSPWLPKLATDHTKLRQSLLNLLSNACKFTENGRIELEVALATVGEARRVVFQVKDSGIGMSQEQVGKLFQEFAQADASTTRRYGGSGLGLAITQRFCQMLGGGIEVASVPGGGSTFTLWLPALSVEPIELTVCPSSPVTDQGGKLVLVVDDHATMHDLMRRYLEKAGYRVAIASNGAEGLRLARELRPDAITLDVMMPDVDGWNVLARLKSDPALATIPVVMCTMVDDRSKGMALDAADYLVKPIEQTRLTQTIGRLVRTPSNACALIVDDDAFSRTTLQRQLRAEGLKVLEAASGLEGLTLLEEHRPDLVLLDLTMDGMDGFKFIDEVAARPTVAHTPIVVVTAASLDSEDRQRLRASVEAVMTKGCYETRELVARVRAAMQQQSARQEAAV